MAVLINSFGFKRIFQFEKIFIKGSKNLYTKTFPLMITSNRAERIFDQNLKKMHKCEDESSKLKLGYNLVKEIFCDKDICGNSSFIADRNKELINYNLGGGRSKRVKVFLDAYKHLTPHTKLSDKCLLQAYVMAWLHQLMLYSLMLIDDAVDNSKMRRNKIAWHNIAGRLIANDPFLLGTGVYTVLRNIFEKEPYFLPCLNVFYETFWWATCSTYLDSCSADILGKNLERCSWEVCRTATTLLVGSTSFQAPLFTAFHMAGYNFDSIRNDLKEICALLGFIVKDQNDYCDRYSTTRGITIGQGKTKDEDIRMGKLTWFILTALERSNAEQKKILQKCYGKDNPECFNAVVNVYEQLQLKDEFFKYQEELIDYTVERIMKLPDEKIHPILLNCVHVAENWYNENDVSNKKGQHCDFEKIAKI